jgi:hypothetical protein
MGELTGIGTGLRALPSVNCFRAYFARRRMEWGTTPGYVAVRQDSLCAEYQALAGVGSTSPGSKNT